MEQRRAMTTRAVNWTLVVLCIFGLSHLKEASAGLQANGCEAGWADYGESCYKVGLGDATADSAKSQCEKTGSYLSSVWSEEEKAFILSLWQFPYSDAGDLWIGLWGSASGSWVYHDQSEVKIKKGGQDWSILKSASTIPKATPTNCAVLQVDGSLTFRICSEESSAYICKKALPKVFAIMNNPPPKTGNQLGRVQPFERLLPPTLTVLPVDADRLEVDSLTSEVGCAFRCFNVTACKSFQVRCQQRSNCDTYWCSLLSRVPA